MRKTFISTAFTGALAFIAAIQFTSCQSNDLASDTPSHQDDFISTDLAISLPKNAAGKHYKGVDASTQTTQNQGSTRASQEVVQGQNNPVFRGMSNIVLVPYATDSTKRYGANVGLDNIGKDELSSISNAKVYNDVSLAVGTAGIRVYAHATDTTEEKEGYHFTNGTLTATGLIAGATTDIETIGFTPVSITNSTTPSDKAQYLANLLTNIANTTANGISWENNSTWKLAHTNFVRNGAGSSRTIIGLIQRLYNTLSGSSDAMALALINKINSLSLSEIGYTDGGTSPCIINNNGTLSLNSALTNYPSELNLPDGAAIVKWNTSTGFQPMLTSGTTNENVSTIALNRYVYMPNLWYHISSPLRTSTQDLSSVLTTNIDWSNIVGNTASFTHSSVTTTTRTIALERQVRYGVGRMDFTINLANGNILYDKKGEAVTPNPMGFQVTGIIIGGQKPVDYNFNPITGSGITQYAIYDNTMTNFYANVNGSATNYTLVLPSSIEEAINIAIELVNNTGQDFEGATGIIPNGGKFYLIANLNPPDAKSGYATDGLNQVFKQDYTTTVKLTIPQNSADESTDHERGLGNAYNVLPDLSKPSLSLGFSVDPTWQAGLYFEVEL